jgi:hypothetical protein
LTRRSPPLFRRQRGHIEGKALLFIPPARECITDKWGEKRSFQSVERNRDRRDRGVFQCPRSVIQGTPPRHPHFPK